MLPGFGLRVSTQSKVFFAEGQVDSRTRRGAIGRADFFAPEIARKKALMISGDMADGHGSNAEKRQEAAGQVTVELALERFLELRSLSARTISLYQRTERLYLLKSGAAYRIRTYDPIITNDVLYQLS